MFRPYMDTVKLEIEVGEELDPWSVLCQLHKNRFVDKAFCSKGVLTIYVDKNLTQEAIFEIGFNAGLIFGK